MSGRGRGVSGVLCRENILPYAGDRRDQTLDLKHLNSSLAFDAKNLGDFERM